ncbi:MAG: HD domain-containing protein [Patescibacteria group bacterium]|jgi:putative nucleotidyltransferase with HDIG domain
MNEGTPRIEQLKNKVSDLYLAKDPNRADWADWLFENHIFVVAKNAEAIAKRYGAKADLVVAAALLHDIADAVMQREDEHHEEKSYEIAKELLGESGFSHEEIPLVIDAIKHHACHGEDLPETLEGKVMATADGMAHLQTDFYDFALGVLLPIESPKKIRAWALPKIERDFRKKIFFDEIRTELTGDYERVKKLFEI